MGTLGELSPGTSIAVGIVVGLCSTGIQGIGLTLQRKSHLLEDEKEDENIRRPAYRRRRWQLGMFLFIGANLVGSTIQITTLPLPVLSTLQASGLVFNTICATIILGEPFTRWSFAGTALVAGGAILIALFGGLPEPSHNLTQLLELLARRQFILWMVLTATAMLGVLVVVWVLARLRTSNNPRFRLWRGMSYGAISGVLSAHSLLVAKSAVELFVRTVADRLNQFNRWQSWMILLCLTILAVSQLYFLHRGLKLCSTSILYPFVFCIYNVVAILDGLIYFRQTSRLPPLHAGSIALGTIILLSGVVALSWRQDGGTDSPPPDVHTLLTPGMGIVEDTTTDDEADSDVNDSATDDDDDLSLPSESTALLLKGGATFSKKQHNKTSQAAKNRRRNISAARIDYGWDEVHHLGVSHAHWLSWSIRGQQLLPSIKVRSLHRGIPNTENDNFDEEVVTCDNVISQVRHALPMSTGSGAGKCKDVDRKKTRGSRRYRSLSSPLPKRAQVRAQTSDGVDANATRGRRNSRQLLRDEVRRSSFGGWLSAWWRGQQTGRAIQNGQNDERVRRPPAIVRRASTD